MSHHPFPSSSDCGTCRHPRGILRTALTWAAIGLVAVIAFSTGVWALGLVFHLVGFLLRIALVTAVVALVWRWVTRKNRSRYGS